MIKLIPLLLLLLLSACGPSNEEKQNIAIITCNIITESKNMDPAMTIKEINLAREKINGEPYLFGVDKINEAIRYDLCENLVLLSHSEYQLLLEAEKAEESRRRAEESKRRAEQAKQKIEEKRRIGREENLEEIILTVQELKNFLAEQLSKQPQEYCNELESIYKDMKTYRELSFPPEDLIYWNDDDFREIIDTFNQYKDQRCNFEEMEEYIALTKELVIEYATKNLE